MTELRRRPTRMERIGAIPALVHSARWKTNLHAMLPPGLASVALVVLASTHDSPSMLPDTTRASLFAGIAGGFFPLSLLVAWWAHWPRHHRVRTSVASWGLAALLSAGTTHLYGFLFGDSGDPHEKGLRFAVVAILVGLGIPWMYRLAGSGRDVMARPLIHLFYAALTPVFPLLVVMVIAPAFTVAAGVHIGYGDRGASVPNLLVVECCAATLAHGLLASFLARRAPPPSSARTVRRVDQVFE